MLMPAAKLKPLADYDLRHTIVTEAFGGFDRVDASRRISDRDHGPRRSEGAH